MQGNHPHTGQRIAAHDVGMGPFKWLTHKRHRRAALLDTERAIRRGQFDGADPAIVERRRALLRIVSALVSDPDLSGREVIRLARLVAVISERNGGNG